MIDPFATLPGCAEARAEGCICNEHVPKLVLDHNDCLRRIYDGEPHCPVHGLAAMRAWLAHNP